MRICAVLCGVVFWGGLLAQEARLQDDSRLQETLAIQKPFASLREVLRTVQEATGVPLYADRAIAEDKVCILTRERPAHEILTRLAETLRYRWQPSTDGSGYRLVQPASERAREQGLLRAYEQSPHRRHPESRSARQCNSSAATTASSWSNSPPTRSSRLSPEAHALLKWAVDETPVALGLHALATLPDSALQRLAHGEPIAFSTHPESGEFVMPQPLQRKVLELYHSVPENSVLKAEVVFFVEPRTLILKCAVRVDTGRIESTKFFEVMYPSQTAEQILAQHPQSAVWREWHSDAAAFRALKPAPTRAPTLTIPEPIRRSPLVVLIRYAREHGLDLYSDAYRLSLFLGDERERTPQTDFEQARRQLFWVRLEGETLMARYRAYPLLRPSEIPESLLEPLEQKLRAKQEITLDEWAAFATQLTPMQIARADGRVNLAGQPAYHETLVPLDNLIVALPALRFWASLSPQQRQAALGGERLLPERMTPKQRELFLQAFHSRLPDSADAPYALGTSTRASYGSLSSTHRQPGRDDHHDDAHRRPAAASLPYRALRAAAGQAPHHLAVRRRRRIPATGVLISPLLSEPSPGSPRGWLLYFAVDDWQRVYILIAE
jgi:hypothetical protein